MGDRANIQVIRNSVDSGIYFYTHWAGTELPETLQAALKRGKGRWDDDQYLARIIFSEMIKDFVLEETGYGISNYVGDGESRILVIDMHAKTVKRKEKLWTFQEYINLTEEQLNQVWWGD